MKHDVFISYSSLDQKVVEGLCGHLESRGIRCFVAYRDIPRGVVWADAIVEALDESRMMVVVFSDHFNNSPQVNREIEIASEDRKHILTYRLTDTAFRGAKKYYLKNLNWIDAFPDPEKSFGSVAEGIAKLLDLKLKKVVKAEETPVVPAPDPIPALKPVPVPAPQPVPTPDPNPKPKPYPKWLWALALMPLVLIGLWLGFRNPLEPEVLSGKGRDGVYHVGDYYNRNGKEGVVFVVSDGGKHGKIVSLTQSANSLAWCSFEEYNRKISTGARDQTNGLNNQRTIAEINGWREKYPAFAWCADQGDGWYLPAIEELETFLLGNAVHNAVNRTLAAKGATKLYNEGDFQNYWSSTEYDYEGNMGWNFYAVYVNMRVGNTFRFYKNSNYYVRAVSAF